MRKDKNKESKAETVDAPSLMMRAAPLPQTANDDERTIEVEYTTGERVFRPSWFGEDYFEELSLEPEHMRLDRLKNGVCPVLDSHISYGGVNRVLGAVIDGDQRMATLKMSRKPESDGIWQDLKDGILRNISVGYRVYKYEDVTEDDDEVRVLRAVDWEPIEISLVPVPADSGAGVRSDNKTNPCVITDKRNLDNKKGKVMKNEKNNAPQSNDQVLNQRSEGETTPAPTETAPTQARQNQEPAENPVNADAVRSEGVTQERQRVSEIQKIARNAGMDDAFAQYHIEKGTDLNKFREAVIDQLADADEKNETRSHIQMGQSHEEKRSEVIASALLNRANPRHELVEGANEFRGMSLMEIAREVVGYRESKGMSKMQIAERALHSTSDFPEILANVASKSLRDAYADTRRTFTAFSRQVNMPDFKEMKRVALSNAPSLKQVVEGGEYESGSFSEGAETIQLMTYGRIVSITRQALINDDLDAFTRAPQKMGAASARLENKMAYDVLTSNPVMADGVNLFHADHKNLTDALLDVDGIGKLRELLRVQTDPSGEDIMNYELAYLIVPAALETKAAKLQAQITPDSAANANPFRNTFELIVDGYLDNDSALNFYGAGNPSMCDTLEYGYLDGQEGPYIETKQGFETDGVDIKVRHDFAVKAIEHRALAKSTNNAS